jgi:hypothetical protein
MNMSRSALAFLGISLLAGLPAAAAESKQTEIDRAMSAAPARIAASAKIIDMDAKGKPVVLRPGTNGFTCYIGHAGAIADDPFCADAAGMQWTYDWMAHKTKPTNTTPGVVYMLAGGTDWSANDPWATKGTPIHEPPHYMIMWPFTAKTSGLSPRVKNDGTWIMWAGTPYAHLMVNQKP